jgi:nuclear pore complex protein Nup205
MGLSLLTKIIELDGANNHKWIKHLNETGYIKCLVNSIANSDNKLLEESFGTPAKNEKAIYLFESKLALFTAIAGSQFGADCLLKSGLITTFSTSSVFNIRARFDR